MSEDDHDNAAPMQYATTGRSQDDPFTTHHNLEVSWTSFWQGARRPGENPDVPLDPLRDLRPFQIIRVYKRIFTSAAQDRTPNPKGLARGDVGARVGPGRVKYNNTTTQQHATIHKHNNKTTTSSKL